MADKTNITDFDPATGRTTTTLVSTHDRSPQDEARRDGGQHATWHRSDQAAPAARPTLASAAPATVAASAGPTTITLTGTGFTSGADVTVDGNAVTTTFISATQVSFSYDPTAAGTAQLAVQNPDGQVSNNVAFTTTAGE